MARTKVCYIDGNPGEDWIVWCEACKSMNFTPGAAGPFATQPEATQAASYHRTHCPEYLALTSKVAA